MRVANFSAMFIPAIAVIRPMITFTRLVGMSPYLMTDQIPMPEKIKIRRMSVLTRVSSIEKPSIQ